MCSCDRDLLVVTCMRISKDKDTKQRNFRSKQDEAALSHPLKQLSAATRDETGCVGRFDAVYRAGSARWLYLSVCLCSRRMVVNDVDSFDT